MKFCADCPYIKESYDSRMELYEDELEPEWVTKECWCDKVGGKIWHNGYCSEGIELEEDDLTDIDRQEKITEKEKARNRRRKTEHYKKRLAYRSRVIRFYPGIAYPVDKHGDYVDDDDLENIAYYKKYNKTKHSTAWPWYKRYSNKCIRKMPLEETISRGNYKKVFDLWWTMY